MNLNILRQKTQKWKKKEMIYQKMVNHNRKKKICLIP